MEADPKQSDPLESSKRPSPEERKELRDRYVDRMLRPAEGGARRRNPGPREGEDETRDRARGYRTRDLGRA